MCGDDFEFISSMPFFRLFISNFNPCISSFIATNLVLRPYNLFFFYQGVLHRHWRFTGQQGKGGDHLLFLSTISTLSRTLRYLFATLHVRWLSHIFNRTACIYQAATRWDLPSYRITIWLIDDVTLVFVCLFSWWFDSSFFVTAIWDGKPMDSSSHSTITLVLQANRLTKCASPTCFACCFTEHKSKLSRLAILKLIRTKHQSRVCHIALHAD